MINNKNDKITIGTVFSGIGAFEFAFKRLNIPHKLLFACDNGDVEINIDTEKELKIIKKLKTVEDKRKYVKNLYAKLSKKQNFVEKSFIENYKIENNNLEPANDNATSAEKEVA